MTCDGVSLPHDLVDDPGRHHPETRRDVTRSLNVICGCRILHHEPAVPGRLGERVPDAVIKPPGSRITSAP
jgi:hypothetical protein